MKLEDEIKQKNFSSAYHKVTINILFTASWLSTQTSRILKPFSITLQQYNVLRILRGQNSNPASVGLIQERMLDKSSNASRLVDKLLEKKLIERKTCADDRRQVDIRITQKGLDTLGELDGLIQDMEKNFMKLNEEEAMQLSDMLDKMRD